MPWFMLLVLALILIAVVKVLRPADEVYTLAIYCTGLLSALWGFAIAPILVQLTLGVLAFSWIQFSSLPSPR